MSGAPSRGTGAAPGGAAARPGPGEGTGGGAVGLALVRDAEVLGSEPFFHEFIAGMERVLVPRGMPVLLQVVATVEQAAERMRSWAALGQVAGVILIDLLPGDERIGLVRSLGLPAVVIGDPETAAGLPAVWTQDDVAMRDVVGELVAAGHHRLGHVRGPAEMAHTIIRRETFVAAAREHGARTTCFDGDYSEAAGREAVERLVRLRAAERPTALVFDNDVMALGALHAAQRHGIGVPGDVALVAWDDSALCQLAAPPLSAVSHDVQELGELVADVMLETLAAGPEPGAARVETAAPVRLVVRGGL
ncbi:LacI family DNA-binding transcriptional regulator [Streptomyces sp. NPDC060243]|uniref:LacI family DNA-binding transcriptional regulator n=1 Tax=Streptomyces sp. NPDC060243 TaxID=3347081 RepID=UPI00366A2657